MNTQMRRVDNLLAKANLADTEVLYKTKPQEMGKFLKVDTVIFGDISNG